MRKADASCDHAAGNGIQLKLKDRVAYRFLRIAGAELKCLEGFTRTRFGLRIGKWKVLSIIGFFAPLSGTKLSDLTSLEADKISRVTDSLVKLGLVHRDTDPLDRRRAVFSLTLKGTSVNREIEKVRQNIELALLCDLSARELSVFYNVLNQLDQRAADILSRKDAWLMYVGNEAKAKGRHDPPGKSIAKQVRRKSA